MRDTLSICRRSHSCFHKRNAKYRATQALKDVNIFFQAADRRLDNLGENPPLEANPKCELIQQLNNISLFENPYDERGIQKLKQQARIGVHRGQRDQTSRQAKSRDLQVLYYRHSVEGVMVGYRVSDWHKFTDASNYFIMKSRTFKSLPKKC